MPVHTARDIMVNPSVSPSHWYYIEPNACIVKLFLPSGRDVTSLSATAVTEFQQNFLSVRQNRRLSWKWYELTCPWLPWMRRSIRVGSNDLE